MKLKTCLLLLFTVISISSFAQSDSTGLNKTVRALNDYYSTRPVEKVYLHLDKSYYIPGDTIWFKAYTVIGNLHQLSALSRVLYVELINNKDSIISRHIVKLVVGLGWGDFALSHTLRAGNYHIRAYTNWMRNAGTDYFYDQMIKIEGQQAPAVPAGETAQLKPDIQFFPEGGQLVNGVRSKIAVKCVGPNGLGRDISGTITDNDGNEVASFATQHLGMGIFALIPQAGKTYKAKITAADSSQYTVDLPEAQQAGYTLAVNSSDADSIYVKVAANDQLFQAKQNSLFYLVAQSGGKVYYTAQGKLAAEVFTTRIAKSRFPSGIVQFTLFSQRGEPLNERVIFIRNDDTIKLKLFSPSQKYTTRQKVKIDIGTSNGKDPALQGSFSVSVINESRVSVNENAEVTILNSLLLTSDIKGYIEQPNYYFNSTDDGAQANLDILMLTQGYRRFEWKKVLNNSELPPAYQPERSLEITGGVKTPSGNPAPNGKVTLMASRENFLADTVADMNGNFKFTDLELSDTAKTIIRARKQHNGSNVAIYVKQPSYPAIVKSIINTDTATALTPVMLQNIGEYRARMRQDSLRNGRQLKEVIIKDKTASKPDIYNNYGTSLEYEANMKMLNREYYNLSDALAILIPGTSYINNKIRYENGPVRLMIDDLQHDVDDINLYSPGEIDNIRMISATGSRPALLMVTTKRFAGTDTASTVLKEVVIKDKKIRKSPDLSNSTNLNGAGNADQIIMGNILDGCVKLSDCLNGRVFGVSFGVDGTPSSNRAQGHLSGSTSMVVIIDGSLTTGDHLDDINPSDVYSIEVLRSGAYLAIYGSEASGGALVITTKRGSGNFVTSESPAGLIIYPFKGFSKARAFYSPKYDGPKTEAQAPDLRSTIYWNPNIITDKDGKASFEYYNADTKGTYRVVVEGIDDNGNLGRQVYKYTVE